MRLRAGLLLIVSLVESALFATPVGTEFRVDSLSCKGGIQCSTSEGMQPGLTTVEVEGTLPQLAGTGVRVVVATRDTTQLVFDRKVGIMSNGKITISLPVYNWQDGDYVLLIAKPNDMKTPVAGGVFRKRTGSGATTSTRSEPTPQRQSTPSSGWVGEWLASTGPPAW